MVLRKMLKKKKCTLRYRSSAAGGEGAAGGRAVVCLFCVTAKGVPGGETRAWLIPLRLIIGLMSESLSKGRNAKPNRRMKDLLNLL